MSLKIIGLLTMMVSGLAMAADGKRAAGLGIEFEPVVGYERTTKLIPTSHTVDRMLYGARVSAGFPLLSLEAEYLHGTDNEIIAGASYTDTDEQVKLGVRSTINLGRVLQGFGRAGGQATRNTHTEVVGPITTNVTNPLTYKPYAGAGLKLRLTPKFYLTAGVTVVFLDFPKMDQNSYQGTAGFVVHLP